MVPCPPIAPISVVPLLLKLGILGIVREKRRERDLFHTRENVQLLVCNIGSSIDLRLPLNLSMYAVTSSSSTWKMTILNTFICNVHAILQDKLCTKIHLHLHCAHVIQSIHHVQTIHTFRCILYRLHSYYTAFECEVYV